MRTMGTSCPYIFIDSLPALSSDLPLREKDAGEAEEAHLMQGAFLPGKMP